MQPPANAHTARLDLNLIQEDPRNPNIMAVDRYESAKRHIEQTGFVAPLIIRTLPKESRFYDPKGPEEQYMLLDGKHRRQMLVEIGKTEWDVHIWPQVSDVEAGIYLTTLNRNTGEDDLMLKAQLIDELREIVPLEDLSQVLPDSVEELQGLLDLRQDMLSFDLGIQPDSKPPTQKETAFAVRFVLLPSQKDAVELALLHLERSVEGHNKPSKALTKLAEHYLSTLSEDDMRDLRIELADRLNQQPILPEDDSSGDDAGDGE